MLRTGVEVGHEHNVLDARQLRQHLAQHRAAVVRHTGPMLAIDGDQHLGFDLPEAVQHGHRPHVRAAHAPDSAQAGAGQERDDGVRRVWQVGTDAVPRRHTHRTQGVGQGRGLASQLGPAELSGRRHAFVLEHDGGVACGVCGVCGVGVAKHLLRAVDLCAGEPARAGQGSRLDKLGVEGRGRLTARCVGRDSCATSYGLVAWTAVSWGCPAPLLLTATMAGYPRKKRFLRPTSRPWRATFCISSW